MKTRRHVVSLARLCRGRQVMNIFFSVCLFSRATSSKSGSIISDLDIYFDVSNCMNGSYRQECWQGEEKKVETGDFRYHVKLLFGSEQHRGLVRCLNWVNNLRGTCGPMHNLYDTVTDSCRACGLIYFFFFLRPRNLMNCHWRQRAIHAFNMLKFHFIKKGVFA